MTTPTLASRTTAILGIFSITSLMVTMFLYYIDEGNYSLEGITDIGNIIALGFYFFAMLIAQAVIFTMVEKRLSAPVSLTVSVFTGVILGSIIMAMIFGYLMSH